MSQLDAISSFPVEAATIYASTTGRGLLSGLVYDMDVNDEGADDFQRTVSPSGYNKAKFDYIGQTQLTGVNIGDGYSIYRDVTGSPYPDTLIVSKVYFDDPASFVVTTYDDATSASGIFINYIPSLTASAETRFIQGGKHQIHTMFAFNDFAFGTSADMGDGKSSYTVSGSSTSVIPICANMQNSSLYSEEGLSGYIDNYYNSDICLGKIAIRVPSANAFDDNYLFAVGTIAEPDRFGSFYTRTSADIASQGDIYSITYPDDKGYYDGCYFNTAENIVVTPSGANAVFADNAANVNAKFQLRVFYDNVRYDNKDYYKGFVLGGSAVQGLVFANETEFAQSTTHNPLDEGTGASSDKDGFVFGGEDLGITNMINAIHMDTSTEFVVSNALSNIKKNASAIQSTLNAYIAGGQSSSLISTALSVIERFSLDTESISVHAASLTTAAINKAAIFGLSKACWVGGQDSAGASLDTITQMDFDTDAVSEAALTITAANNNQIGLSSRIRGYLCGGGDASTQIEALPYDTLVASVLSNSIVRADNGAGLITPFFGYICQGNDGSTDTSSIQKLDFFDEAVSTLSNSLLLADTGSVGVQHYIRSYDVGFPWVWSHIWEAGYPLLKYGKWFPERLQVRIQRDYAQFEPFPWTFPYTFGDEELYTRGYINFE